MNKDIEGVIYNKLKTVIEAHPLFGDITAKSGIAVYALSTNPLRDKAGIYGYSGELLISVFNKNKIVCENKTAEVLNLFNSVKDEEFDNMKIRHVRSTREGYDYSPDDDIFFSEITFNILTSNT